MRRYAWFGAALTAPCGPSGSRLLCALLLVALALACAEKAEPTESVESDSKTFLPGDQVDLDGDGLPDGVAVDSDGDGVADGVDIDGDGTADLPLPGGPPLPEEEEEEEEDECPDENPYCDEEPPDPDGCSGEQ